MQVKGDMHQVSYNLLISWHIHWDTTKSFF